MSAEETHLPCLGGEDSNGSELLRKLHGFSTAQVLEVLAQEVRGAPNPQDVKDRCTMIAHVLAHLVGQDLVDSWLCAVAAELRRSLPAGAAAMEASAEAASVGIRELRRTCSTLGEWRDPCGRYQRLDEAGNELDTEPVPGTTRIAYFPVVYRRGQNPPERSAVVEARVQIVQLDGSRRDETTFPRVFFSPTSRFVLDRRSLAVLEESVERLVVTEDHEETFHERAFLVDLDLVGGFVDCSTADSRTEEGGALQVVEITETSHLVTLLLCARAALENVFLRPIVLTGTMDSKSGEIEMTGDEATIRAKAIAVAAAMKKRSGIGWEVDGEGRVVFYVPQPNAALQADELSGFVLRPLSDTFEGLLRDKWTYFTDGFDAYRTTHASRQHDYPKIPDQNVNEDAAVRTALREHLEIPVDAPDDYLDYFGKQFAAAHARDGSESSAPFHSFPVYVGHDPKAVANWLLAQFSCEPGSFDTVVPVPLYLDEGLGDLPDAIVRGLEELKLDEVPIGEPFASTPNSQTRRAFLERVVEEKADQIVLVAFGPKTEKISNLGDKDDLAPWRKAPLDRLLGELDRIAQRLSASTSPAESERTIGGAIFVASDAHHDDWIRRTWATPRRDAP